MARSPSSRSRSSGRGRSGSSRSGGGASSQQAVLIGAGAIAVILVVVFMMQGGSGPAAANVQPVPAPAVQPKAPPAQLPATPPSTSKKALKPPKTPAPELTQATLLELMQLLGKGKELHNAGVNARNAGDNLTARAREGEAKQVLEQWTAKIATQLRWQEEAQMEDWQQPPEYLTLERIYGEYQTLTKKVRMGGG